MLYCLVELFFCCTKSVPWYLQEERFKKGRPYPYDPLSHRRIAEAMTLSVFYHYNAWTVRLDPIAPR